MSTNTSIETRFSPAPGELDTMSPSRIAEVFKHANLMQKDRITLLFTDLDRLAAGGVIPQNQPVALPACKETGTDYFLQRREMAVINLGGAGSVTADGQSHDLETLALLYLGKGVREVAFASADAKNPARFLFFSAPAHASHPTAVTRPGECKRLDLGSPEQVNVRTIHQMVHEDGIASCQLTMGLTEMAVGSVWNTMPPHLHHRRSELYFYFDLGDGIVAHFLGTPEATRHTWIRNEELVLSPPWSIHSGCGTQAYRFVWVMAGENQRFADMDPVPPAQLR